MVNKTINKILLLGISMCIFSWGSIVIFGENIEQTDNSVTKIMSTSLKQLEPKDPKQKELYNKVQERLNDSWIDIKKSFNIDDEKYIQIKQKDLNDFLHAKMKNFNDKDFCYETNKKIVELLRKSPLNSVIPLVLVAKDKSELIVAFKDKNGKNHFKKVNLKTKKLTEKVKMGTKIKSIKNN